MMSEEYKSKIEEGIELESKRKVSTPSLYKVFLLNDDYTTMDFVVLILENVFHQPPVEATRIMLHVHKNGKGLAGIYTREIAETKVSEVHEMSQKNNFPLKCTMEEA
jgi:ATP-dependent Clp protease adaptor protein ClpS